LSGIFGIRRLLATCIAVGACSQAAWALPPGAATPAVPATAVATTARHVNLATFDGADPPMDLLQAFDAVVLDPSRSFDPSSRPLAHTIYVARTAPQPGESAQAFVEQEIAPLWQRGFRVRHS